MKIRITWKSASNYNKVYEVELLGRVIAYYPKVFDWQESGNFMDDTIGVRYDNGWETWIEPWKMEVLHATPEEREMLDNPTIWRH